MKKLTLFLFAIAFISFNSFAQVANYTFSQTTATFDTLMGGKILGSGTTAAGTYFADSTVAAGSTTVTAGIGLPIGFTFKFNNTNYDVFGVNANGWIAFGQSALSPTSVNMVNSSVANPISATSTASAVLQNRVCAFGRGLVAQTISKLSYATLGTAPNRTLVVEWRNYKRSTGGSVDTLSVQIRLYETTNLVQFVYGTMKVSSNSSAQLGLRGQANTDFNNRTTTTNWSATTAGTTNAATMTLSATVFPVSGLVFNWTPPVFFQFDAGLTSINSPITPVTLGTNSVSVTIKNFGTDSLKTASIGWKVNGVVQTSSPFTNPGMLQNATNGPIILGAYNFSFPGYYNIVAWTSLPNGSADGNTTNDTVMKSVYVQSYAAIPFSEGFDSVWVNKSSTHDVPSLFWINNPVTGNNSWRRDDDGTSASWTGTAGAYTPAGSNSSIHSARFHTNGSLTGTIGTLDLFLNFAPVGSKVLKFWQINTAGTDSLTVSISTDGGATFNILQKYNTATTWTQRQIPLGASVSTNVILRFIAKSNAGTSDIGIDDVQITILTPNDAGITSIDSPGLIVSGNSPVAVTIKNFGSDSLATATIGYSVNGAVQTPYAFLSSPKLAPNASNGPVTIGNYNFSAVGFYTIKAWSSNPNSATDGDHTNDTIVKQVYCQAFATIPFMETFDNTWVNKNDTNDVPTNYWKNTPAFGNNSWRRDEDTISGNWTEGYGGAFTPTGADATAHSARFHSWMAANNTNGIMDLYLDLSPTGSKLLDFWYLNTSGNDSLTVYLSTNGGTSFSFIKKLTTASVWTRNIINIGSTTASNCIIRFRAVSDYGQTDIGIDQAQVYLLPANEMAAYSWESPTSGCGLTNAEHVTVKVINKGTAAQTNIPVKYSINGGTSFVGPETIPGPVIPGDTATYTFNATSDFSAAGIYHCLFAVKNPGDALAMNDTLFTNIASSNVISTIPFTENFNSGSSNYLLLAANADANVFYDTTGTQGTYGLHFTGKTTNLWTTGTTSANVAWSKTTHQATAITCGVNASGVTTLGMKFDLRETTGSNNNYTYTWYAAIVNGTDTLKDNTGRKFFNPVSMNDAYATKYFNLTPYAGSNFTLKFISSCRRDVANSSNGIGDNVFFDNLSLYVPPVMNDLGHDTSICQGNSITFNAGAGTGYTYLWTRLPAGDTVGNSQTYTVTTSGTYQVVVTNNLGYSNADAVTVTVINAPIANAGTDVTVAYLGSANLFGLPTNGTYTYSWSPADSLVAANIQNPVTVPMHTSTIFTLSITNSAGCVGSDEVIVFVTGGPLSTQAFATPDTLCVGAAVNLQALPSGGTGTYSYEWTSVPSGFTSTALSATDNPAASLIYHLSVSDGTDTVYASVPVVVYSLPSVYLGHDTTLCSINTIALHAPASTSYLWSTGETTQNIVVDSTDALGGIANIWVAVTNANGCVDKDTVAITFVSCSGINEYGNDAVIALYPNPTTGLTYIAVDGLNTKAALTIYSLQGQSVYSGSVAGNALTTLDLSALPKGIYLVRIQNEERSLISKLIVQ